MKAKLKEWDQGRLPLQSRLAAALAQYGADRRGQVPVSAREERRRSAGRAGARLQAHRHQPEPDQRTAGTRPRPSLLRPLRRAGHGALSRPASANKLGPLDEKERDKLLLLVRAGRRCGDGSPARPNRSSTRIWPRSKATTAGLDRLLEQLRLWHGGLRAEPGHFTGWSLGARFYPVLYLLTRMGEARDWGTGLPLKAEPARTR
ncbi:MAG: hypothetical protein MZV65_42490 [Chromatiales bacterium]|nr:hypothetical protein [Chromatiales bacterium]